ncbi:MAG: 50S ribosomal protein L10 [Pseudomonadota bacterium]
MNKKEKEDFVADMRERLERAEATFLVDYRGLNVEAINRVRKDLRGVGTEFHVVKNRLLKLASQGTETASIKEHFVGPCALAITYDDLIAPAKVLVALSKDYDKLKIRMGQISGRPLDVDSIKRLVLLPGRNELISQVLSTMQAVPTSFVRVLHGIIANLLYALKALEIKKGEETSGTAN